MERSYQRSADQLRPVEIIPGFTSNPEGSVLMKSGGTMVLCTAMIEEKVPPFLRGGGSGWVTAEYSMLPGSTDRRSVRESARGKIGGRTYEIQRLVGRSLRGAVDMQALGERTVWLDCDVLQADGGTRTASITGAFVALYLALQKLHKSGSIEKMPILDHIAAVSVGMVDGELVLDLDYSEDSRAEVDMNVVMTGQGLLVEVQGTAEGQAFSREQLNGMLDLASLGINELIAAQKAAIERV